MHRTFFFFFIFSLFLIVGAETAFASIPDYVLIPILGKFPIQDVSLFFITVVIAAADGFNPCATWVLLFLINLVLVEKSRRKIFIIVGTFILASGLVYFLILNFLSEILGLLQVLMWIPIFIGAIAIITGAFRIKSFFKEEKITCKVSDNKIIASVNLFLQKIIKSIVGSKQPLYFLGAIIVLAIGVNLNNFVCSIGFPLVYTQILVFREIIGLYAQMFFLLYVFVFMLDELIIFSVVFFTLKKLVLSNQTVKWVNFIGGLLMIILGTILIFAPEMLVIYI